MLFYVLFLGADVGLHDRRNEVGAGVKEKQRHYSDGVVHECGDGDHYHCEGLKRACDGVRLRVVALGDEQGIEAVVGDVVDAAYGAEQEAADRQYREAEKIQHEYRRQDEIQSGAYKIKGVDGAFSGKAVKKRTAQHRYNRIRQHIDDVVQGEHEGGLCVVEYKQTHGKARQRTAEHGHHAAERDYRKILCPKGIGAKFVIHFSFPSGHSSGLVALSFMMYALSAISAMGESERESE